MMQISKRSEMTEQTDFRGMAWRTPLRMSIALMLGLLTTQAGEAHAAFLLSMTSTNSSAPVGGTGSFDVTLTNSVGATSSVDVAGFSVDLTVPAGNGITFTGVTEPSNATFIFNGNNFGLTPPGTFVTPTEVQGNDFALVGATTLAPGSTFVLVHVTYSVAANATTTPVPVSIINVGTFTTLADNSNPSKNLQFTVGTGLITLTGINPTPVPEPSTLGMGVIATIAFTGLSARRRRNSSV